MRAPKDWPDGEVFHNSIRVIRGHNVKEYSLPPVLRDKIRLGPLPRDHPAYRSAECRGVFATKTLKKGETIGYYACILRPHWAVPFNAYVAQASNDLVWDAFNGGNEMRFVNSNRGIAPQPNVMFGKEVHLDNAPKWVVAAPIVTLRKIKAGEELLLDYGEEYWKSLDMFESELQKTYNPQRVEPLLSQQTEGALVEVDMDQIDLERVFGGNCDNFKTSLCQGTLISLAGDMAEISIFGEDPICVHRSALLPPQNINPLDVFSVGDEVEVRRYELGGYGWWPATITGKSVNGSEKVFKYKVRYKTNINSSSSADIYCVSPWCLRAPTKNRLPPPSHSTKSLKRQKIRK